MHEALLLKSNTPREQCAFYSSRGRCSSRTAAPLPHIIVPGFVMFLVGRTGERSNPRFALLHRTGYLIASARFSYSALEQLVRIVSGERDITRFFDEY